MICLQHYADTVAICFSVGEVDPKSPSTAVTATSPVTPSGIPLVACLYSDRSFFIYDATNIKSIGKFRSCLHHSSGITDIAMLSANNTSLPASAFFTCGEDRTLRVWALDNEDERFRNVYSRDLIHTVHVEDPEFASIKVFLFVFIVCLFSIVHMMCCLNSVEISPTDFMLSQSTVICAPLVMHWETFGTFHLN
jgi:WD40 repeat protein